jgi:thiamine-monophosphate kinase
MQNYSYEITEKKIPISKYLSKLIKIHKFNKSRLVSKGDDYQVLFTAAGSKSRIIDRTSKILGIKITKIGKIIHGIKKSRIIDEKGKKILLKNKGYIHQF